MHPKISPLLLISLGGTISSSFPLTSLPQIPVSKHSSPPTSARLSLPTFRSSLLLPHLSSPLPIVSHAFGSCCLGCQAHLTPWHTSFFTLLLFFRLPLLVLCVCVMVVVGRAHCLAHWPYISCFIHLLRGYGCFAIYLLDVIWRDNNTSLDASFGNLIL